MTRHYPRRVSPFGHPRIKAWLAAPRGFSQPPTSFIASRRLGIHRTPFPAWSPYSSHTRAATHAGQRAVLAPPSPHVPFPYARLGRRCGCRSRLPPAPPCLGARTRMDPHARKVAFAGLRPACSPAATRERGWIHQALPKSSCCDVHFPSYAIFKERTERRPL